MPASNNIATGVTVLSWSWIWLFVALGGSTFGREEIYFPIARQFYSSEYYQGGLVVLVLIIPILLAGTISSLLCVVSEDKISNHIRKHYNTSQDTQHVLQRLLRCCFKPTTATSVSSWTANVSIFAGLVLPCLLYVAMCVARKLPRAPTDDERNQFLLMIVGNSFAFMALLAMSFILIPVSRQSSLLLLNSWFDSPIQAIQYIHITLGYLVLVGVFVHSILHLWRWKLMGEWWIEIIIPPSFCWIRKTSNLEDGASSNQETPLCRNPYTECSCYHHFRNFTGFLGFVAFLVLAIMSVWPRIRRQAYALFYMTHVIASPLAILMTVVHYPRAILYVAPSLLYYVATSFPNMMELHRQKQQACGGGSQGVRILSVQEIASNTTRSSASTIRRGSIISLHLEASAEALRRYRPGQYVKLSCPEISSLAQHPFTINTFSESNKKDSRRVLAIHFRVSGNFTNQLAGRLLSPSMPSVYLNGFMGPMNRLDQVLQHDVVVLVAGGIGITPYLSLLHELVKVASEHDLVEEDVHLAKPRHHSVVLHWICREDSFSEHIQQEYFKPLLNCNLGTNGHVGTTTKLDIRIVIHKTSPSVTPSSSAPSPRYASTGNIQNSSSLADKTSKDLRAAGVPFTPSVFAVGTKFGIRENFVPFLSFTLIGWLGLGIVWYHYTRVIQPTADEQIFNRVWSLVCVVILGWIVSWLINVWTPEDDESRPSQKRRKRRRHGGIMWDRMKSHASDSEDNGEQDEVDCVSPDDVEMRPLSTTAGLNKDSTDVENHLSEGNCNVSIEEVEGRPSVHELISSLDGAQCPGLFVCGPTSLMEDIRRASQERCLIRMRHCIHGTPHIAMYEEAFEMVWNNGDLRVAMNNLWKLNILRLSQSVRLPRRRSNAGLKQL